jgi:16S rRNA (guanine527-N7)-methyltransferase
MDDATQSIADCAADRAQVLAMFDVSRETTARLDRFVRLLLTWQRRTNLIANSTIPTLWVRHVADSLQLLDLAPPSAARPPVWVDLGSGAGFPGLVIACVFADLPGACVHLIESNGKKVAFLRAAVNETGAAAVVHAGRIEDIGPTLASDAHVVTARAVAPLNELLMLVAPILKKGAQALLPKGQDVEIELTEATKYWNIKAEIVPSRTSPTGRIVVVREVSKRQKAIPIK